MQNRFLHLPRIFAVISVILLSAKTINAQAGFFNFTSPPDEIGVLSNCFGAVSSGIPPVVTPTTPGATITLSQFSPSNSFAFSDQFPLGTTLLVKWDVADNVGHSHTFEFGVTFIDITPPVFDALATPTPLTVNSIAEVPPLGPIPVTDNCDMAVTPNVTQTFSQTMPPPLCQAGTFQRTWIATDAAGRAATYTQTIIVLRDSLLPVITVPPVNGTAPCASLPGAYTAWLNAQMVLFTATDASGTPTKSNNAPAGLTSCPAPVTVIFRATDQCGLTATASATFSSSDTQPPTVLVEPKDTIAYCGNHQAKLGEFIKTRAYSNVTDLCATNLTWRMLVNGVERDSAQIASIIQDSILTSICGVKLIGSQSYAKVRAYVRVDFFAKDPCMNEVFVGQGVFGVIDTTAPVITGSALISESCGGGNDQTALNTWINAKGNATVTDNCSSTTWTNFSFTTSNGQTGNGNFNTGPYPTVQANSCNWFTDVTFRATDQCGNTGSKTLRFRLTDNIAPTIGGFPDTTIIYCPTAIPSSFSATVTDNCSTGLVATYTTQYADTICAGNYSFKVRWTVTDQCNNIGTKTQIFAIRDTVRPVFTLVPPNVTFSCDSVSFVPAPVIGTTVTATDPCGAMQGITFTTTNNQNPNPNVCAHYNYEITRRFTATDKCGNTRTAQQVISIRDTKGPTAAIPLPDTIIFCQNLPLNATIPPAIDKCSPVVGPVVQHTQTIVAGTCPDSYTIVVTWRATDVCGNTGLFSRNFLVRDTIRPTISNIPANITVECDGIPLVPAIGSLTVTDNCDATPSVVFSETEIRDPNVASCNHWSNYQIKRQWVVTDACSNTRTYTQTISIIDNTPPVFLVKDTVLYPNTLGQCGANILPPTPLSAYDQCAVLPINATLLDTTAITGPPISDAVCDTVYMAMNALNLPPLQPVTGNAVLSIFLDNADAEGPDEYFRVYGENGVYIGKTDPVTPAQCGSGVTTFNISALNLNNWLTDGQLTLTLVPNGTGPDAINPICPGRRVRSQVSYQYLSPQIGVTITYKVNNGPSQPYPASSQMFLATGTHIITYTVADCVDNSRTATTVIRIDDIEPPLIASPAAQTVYVGVNDCINNWTVPLPNITENCDLSGTLSRSSVITNTRFVNNANAGFVPQDITLNITGLIANAFSGGVLKIRHRGDNGNAGEFFKVLDELGNQFSTTSINPVPSSSCVSFYETVINVSAADINNWAANGSTQIKLVANTDAFTFSDFINPCGPLNAGGFDGSSAVQATLEYDYAIINYEIKNAQQTVVSSGLVVGQQTTANLTAGAYNVKYTTTDQAGNLAQSTFNLTVRDTVKPNALCQNIAIFVSVSGANPYTLSPVQINNGSNDNCAGSNVSLSLSQTLFTCNQSGQIVPVMLTVTDTSGNTAKCTAQVNVNTEMITASSTANICEGGMAQLLCDPPGNDANYTYKWSNALGSYTSIMQNPILNNVQLSQEGTYMVTVTGPTGCTAVGETQLQLIGLPFQPILNTDQTLICAGQGFNLSTNAYTGTDVSYQWYRNTIDTLVATTIQPNLILSNPPTGIHQYFVRIVDLNCSSALSAPLSIWVQVPISATVINSNLNPCEGDLIQLGTNIGGPGITYQWTGPQNFDVQTPPAFPATLSNAGNYTLFVLANGCPGTPTTVNVTVRDRPDAPMITGNTGVCEGATVMLTAQPAAGNPFLWISPDLDTVNTSMTNALILNNVTQADSGYWKVISVLNGCVSPASLPHLVAIETYPVVVVNANTPICQGGVLQLQANVNQAVTDYSWSGPDMFLAFTKEATDNTPSSGNYAVTVSTNYGCSANASINVNVVNPPLITSVTSDAPTCVDGNISVQLFHTLASTANAPYTYKWTYMGSTISIDSNYTIQTANTNDNGDYILTVTDKFGCVSAPQSTTLSLQMIPPVPVLAQANAVCEGATTNVSIANSSDYPPNTSFIWQIPGNPNVVTTAPVYPITNATLANGGVYIVQAQIGDCISDSSALMLLQINKTPAPPLIMSDSPVCAGDTLNFKAQAQPGIMVAEWNWSGPLSFELPTVSGNTPTPFRSPALPEHATSGYSINIVTKDGCQSAQSEPIFVTVKPKPQKPEALTSNNICLPQADTLILSVTPNTQTNLATYTWFSTAQLPPLDTPSLSPILTLTDFSGYTAGQNTFYVVAELDGCKSVKSFNVSANFLNLPTDLAQVQTDSLGHCGPKLDLLAIEPTNGITGLWSLLSGPNVAITNPSSVFSLVDGLVGGQTYQFLWTLSKDACENYSQDTMTVVVNIDEKAMAMADTTICFVSEITLHALPAQINKGYWTQSIGQAMSANTEIVTPDSNITLVTGLGPFSSNGGGLFFTWVIDNLACDPSMATVEVIPIFNEPIAQADSVQCAVNGLTELKATPLEAFETGAWTSPNSNITFNNPSAAMTIADNLEQGDNIFIWTTNDGICGDRSRDTTIVTLQLKPTAALDTVTVPFGSPVAFNVLSNDIVAANNYSVEIITPPNSGQLNPTGATGSGNFTYIPDITYEGLETALYRVCNIACLSISPGDACDFANIELNVGASTTCNIPSVITPNGDKVNDVFIIPCINCSDCPRNNELVIFNQWGDKVFDASPYDQNWDGKNQGGDDLPVGSYFYVLKINKDTQSETKTGFIIIQR
jgi:gliding motility-associated-like protein